MKIGLLALLGLVLFIGVNMMAYAILTAPVCLWEEKQVLGNTMKVCQ